MNLPSELWESIFSKIEIFNLEKIRLTSIFFNEIVKNNKKLYFMSLLTPIIMGGIDNPEYLLSVICKNNCFNSIVLHPEDDPYFFKIQICNWLVDFFQLRNKDREYFDFLLQNCCGGGQIKMCEWAYQTFNFTNIYKSKCVEILRTILIHISRFVRDTQEDDSLRACSWFIKTFKITLDDIKRYDPKLISDTFFDNTNAKILGLFVDAFQSTPNDLISPNDISAILLENSARGNIEFLEVFCPLFGITVEYLRDNKIEVLFDACRNGKLDTAKWLTENFNLKIEDAEISGYRFPLIYHRNGVLPPINSPDPGKLELASEKIICCSSLTDTCKRGDIEICRWLVKTFDYSKIEDFTIVNESFDYACQTGRLDILQLLNKTFKLTFKDVKDQIYLTFKSLGETRNLRLCQWLITTFHIRENYLRNNIEILAHVCMFGELRVVKWLINSFNINERDIRRKNNIVFCNAAKWGNLEVCKWLVERFKLTIEDIRCNNDAILRLVTKHKMKEVYEWLTKTFKINYKSDVFSNNKGKYRRKSHNNNFMAYNNKKILF